MDFWVVIPEFEGDMKLIFLCFALLTNVVLLLGFHHFRVQIDLLGGSRTPLGPPNVLNPFSSAIFIFSTPRSIFRRFVLFLVTKFLLLELGPTGSVSCFVGIRSNPIAVAAALVRSVSLQGSPVWRSQFFACTFFSNKCSYF